MYLVFDIGGTKTRVAKTRTFSEFEEPIVYETPQDGHAGLTKLIEIVQALADGETVAGIAGGVPGPLDAQKSQMVGAGNLTGWVGAPIVRRLRDEFTAPVMLENDADLVGLGEAHFGAGKGEHIVAYMTVSTGVGGGRIVDGHIDATTTGFEPGHQMIDMDHTLCPDCRSGKLEDMVSGTAMRHRFGKAAEEVPAQDPCWQQLAEWLAAGLNNLMVFWSPDVIVLGGAMIVGEPAIPLTETVQRLQDMDTIFPPPPIKKAELGSVGGLFGAMALLQQSIT